jgi:hypothetical protein
MHSKKTFHPQKTLQLQELARELGCQKVIESAMPVFQKEAEVPQESLTASCLQNGLTDTCSGCDWEETE